MKKITFLLSAVLAVFLLSNFVLIGNGNSTASDNEETVKYRVPSKITPIIENSCYGCHNTDSKNEKGKKKLDFDKIGKDYNAIKSSGKLKEIAEVVNNGDMPPEKYLEHNPENALSAAQKKLLADWATIESKKILGK